MAKLSKRDRIGLIVLISILVFFGIILVLTIDRPAGELRDFQTNVLVERRMKNLENR